MRFTRHCLGSRVAEAFGADEQSTLDAPTKEKIAAWIPTPLQASPILKDAPELPAFSC